MARAEYEILERSVAYDGHFRMDVYRVRYRRFDGSWSRELKREVFERGHAAALLPYDPVSDQVVLIEQFRIGAVEAPGGPWLLEPVAGVIEGDESAEEVVRREALEEAGCRIEEIVPIYEYLSSPGGTSERISLYCGKVDASQAGGIHGLAEEGEDIRVAALPFDEAMAELAKRRNNVASLLIALQWLALNRDSLRERWGAKARDGGG